MTDFLDLRGSKLSEIERKRHLLTIERLTEQIGIPITEIGRLYAAELAHIYESSRIREFLPILIARKLRQGLRQGGAQGFGGESPG